MSDTVFETQSQFSRRVGLSRARVNQLVKAGLPMVDGKVDVGAALAWMSRELDPTQRMAQAKAKARPAPAPPAPADDDEADDDAPGGLLEARTQHEWLKVQRAQLALEKDRADVASWAEIDRVLFEHGRRNRDAWLAWAQRAVPDLAAELKVDGALLTAALRKAVTAHLSELSEVARAGR